MKNKLLSLLILLACLSFAQTPAFVNTEEILFLAHFNGTVKPEIGQTDGMVVTAEPTSGKRGFAFNNSVPQAEALNTALSNAFAAYPARGNFNPNAGTLQMLVKPLWKDGGYNHCVFFKVLFDSPDHGGCFVGTNSFYLQKPPKVNRLTLHNDGNLKGIACDLPADSQAWMQLTATWSVDTGKMHLYLNGESVGERKFFPMTREPSEIMFGHPRTWNAQALIDEVRILSRPLSAAEVKQDYLYLMSGKEFDGGKTAQSTALTFGPMPVEESDIGLQATLQPIDFPCPRTAEEIVLDGKLDEASWKQTPVVSDLGAPSASAKLPPPTEIRLLHDKNAFYISAVMHHEDMSKHVAQFDQNDLAIYNDECLEFFLDITNRNDDFYQFCVNSLGSIYDSKGGKKEWNAFGAKAVGTRQEKSWTVEMRIPFAAFKRPTPLPGEIWGARLCREHHQGTTAVSIPIRSPNAPFHQRHSLGRLIFTLGQSSTSIASKTTTFGLGANKLDFVTKGDWPAKANVSILHVADDESHLKEEKRTIDMKADLPLAVNVTSDATSRIVCLFTSTDTNALLGSAFLSRDFRIAFPGLSTMESELEDLQVYLHPVRNIRHPAYEGAQASIARMKALVADYKKQLTDAIAAGKTLPPVTVNDFEALLNGFLKFKNDHLFLVWETSPWENGSPNALPPMDYKPLRALNFQQASNERESRTFIISGLFTGSRVDAHLAVHAIDAGKGVFIPESAFEIATEPFINYLGSKLTSPLVEVPGNIITLTPGEAVRVRVTFNSRDVPPGSYRTRLFIKPLHDFQLPNHALDLNLHVWNFTLPETHEWPIDCFFWGPFSYQNDEAAMLRLMHSRHINWGWTKSHQFTRGISGDRLKTLPKDVPFNMEATLHENQEFFDTARALKMKFVFGWGTTNSYDWHVTMTKRLYDMGFTNDDFIFHALLRDEFAKKDIPSNQKTRDEFAAKGAPWTFMATYLSTPPPAGATLDDIREAKLPEFFKMWCPISGLFSKEERGREVRDFFRQYGCKIWPYRCSTSMITCSLLEYYRAFPWLVWHYGLDGCAFWTCYSPGKANKDCFDFRDGGAPDGITKMDAKRRPIPTKQLEAVCEGLEDVAYASILLKTLEQHPELAKEERDSLNALATTRLNDVRLSPSQQAIDAWRLAVGTAIDKLNTPKPAK